MIQESKSLLLAQSANRETTTQRKTRRTTPIDLNSRSIANSAASTLFTEKPSNWGERK
jgi:hypothetical protein